jgi:hypothetical protein
MNDHFLSLGSMQLFIVTLVALAVHGAYGAELLNLDFRRSQQAARKLFSFCIDPRHYIYSLESEPNQDDRGDRGIRIVELRCCISAAPAAFDRYLAALPAMSLIPFAPLYLSSSRCVRPLQHSSRVAIPSHRHQIRAWFAPRTSLCCRDKVRHLRLLCGAFL